LSLTVYQKKTCITCKKALAYLDKHRVDYTSVDIEKQPPSEAILKLLIDPKNPKASLNTRSAIYKAKDLGKVDASVSQLLAWMKEDPNLIKRPVVVQGKSVIQGFDEDEYKAFIN
jgi:Spx/MgsR family transcriptional regulator